MKNILFNLTMLRVQAVLRILACASSIWVVALDLFDPQSLIRYVASANSEILLVSACALLGFLLIVVGAEVAFVLLKAKLDGVMARVSRALVFLIVAINISLMAQGMSTVREAEHALMEPHSTSDEFNQGLYGDHWEARLSGGKWVLLGPVPAELESQMGWMRLQLNTFCKELGLCSGTLVLLLILDIMAVSEIRNRWSVVHGKPIQRV